MREKWKIRYSRLCSYNEFGLVLTEQTNDMSNESQKIDLQIKYTFDLMRFSCASLLNNVFQNSDKELPKVNFLKAKIRTGSSQSLTRVYFVVKKLQTTQLYCSIQNLEHTLHSLAGILKKRLLKEGAPVALKLEQYHVTL